MFPITPPAIDLSRSRLKALAIWIREDLDPIVAREGPDSLRPDDVLMLHETFVNLRISSNITALDLRATGIHRAVQEVAGVATRWPSRLCDECDKIISVWTAKFGPFSSLHPFLYGRGGRLEGIASVNEYTREALLQRWSQTCPAKIHHKRSHRLGDLGFRAGDWWINTLFAHHAGIIGLEAVEGGTTFDKHGAYAIVLKETGEINSSSESCFSYRVPKADKGRFKLTAATPRSRDPIRVLRSHSINSIWGPKAGVRYEGLYRVTGWSIRTAKTADPTGDEWRQGDIIYEVKLQRIDHVPMEEVTKRPTATEVDDYSEYKRLRKMHREYQPRPQVLTKQPTAISSPQSRVAPPIPQQNPPVAIPNVSKKSLQAVSDIKHKTAFKRPHFDMRTVHSHGYLEFTSSGTVPESDNGPLRRNWSSTTPNHSSKALTRRALSNQSKMNDLGHIKDNLVADTSSIHMGGGDTSKLAEVAPWVDLETDSHSTSLSSSSKAISKTTSSIITGLVGEEDRKNRDLSPDKLNQPARGVSFETRRQVETDIDGVKKRMSSLPHSAFKTREGRKSTLDRSKSSRAKLFDGVSSDEECDDYFGAAAHEYFMLPAEHGPHELPPTTQQKRQNSPAGFLRVPSSTPVSSFGPDLPHSFTRRDALLEAEPLPSAVPVPSTTSTPHSHSLFLPKEDSYISNTNRLVSTGMPTSLKDLISQPRVITPVNSPGATMAAMGKATSTDEDSPAARTLQRMIDGVDVKVSFHNPFSASPLGGKNSRRQSSAGCSVPPHVTH